MIPLLFLRFLVALDAGVAAIGLAGWRTILASSDLPPWANYGLLGVIILAILSPSGNFRLVPGWVHTAVVNERNGYKEENQKLVEKVLTVSESALPALRESTQVVNQAIEELRMIRMRRR